MHTKAVKELKDINGELMTEGTEFYYAMSLGRGAVLKAYTIVGMEWNGFEWLVKAELYHSPLSYDQRVIGRVSTLHGSLFPQRAICRH